MPAAKHVGQPTNVFDEWRKPWGEVTGVDDIDRTYFGTCGTTIVGFGASSCQWLDTSFA